MNYVKHVNIANKFFNMPIFEPVLIDHIDEVIKNQANQKQSFVQFEEDFIKQGSLIRINQNPMIIDFNNSYQLFNNKVYDRGLDIKKLMRVVVKRLNISNQSQTQSSIEGSKPYSIIIRGEKGSGKSIFARNILINLK